MDNDSHQGLIAAFSWEKPKRKKKERHKEITAGLLSGPWSQGTPAVKTSNHMRKSKRFLRVPLLDLLNFYNLVGCQAVGSIDTFHAMPLLSPEKQKRERERASKTAGWIILLTHSTLAFMTYVCFQKGWWPLCVGVWSYSHIRNPHTACPSSRLCPCL